MKKLCLFLLMFITNLSYCSAEQSSALEIEAAQLVPAATPATPAKKDKKTCNKRRIGLAVGAATAAGIITAVLLTQLPSSSSSTPNDAPSNVTPSGNGTTPIPTPFPPCGTIARSAHSLPMNQTLENGTVYEQRFQSCGKVGGCWTELRSKILCPPHKVATVGDAEQEFVNALAPDCLSMPVYTDLGIKTSAWKRSNPCMNPQRIKDNNEGVIAGVKSCCTNVRRTLNAMIPGQPVCSFTTIDPKNIFSSNLLSRNKLQRRNRIAHYTKMRKSNSHKGKKR